MPQLELSQVLSLCSVIIAFLALYRNTKLDTKDNAGQMMEVIIKLESISDGVKEIKSEIKDVKTDVEKMKERITIVEQSTKSAHKRIDGLHNEHISEENSN